MADDLNKRGASPETAQDVGQAREPDSKPAQTRAPQKIAERPRMAAAAAGANAYPFRPKRRPVPVLGTIGSWLYELGFAGEYVLLHIWRVLRDIGLFIGQVLLLIFSVMLRWVGGMLRGLWHDLGAPLRRFRKRRRQLQRARAWVARRALRGGTRQQSAFKRVGVQTLWHFFIQVIGILMPVGAAAVLVFVAYHLTSLNYALAVSYNGQLLGYVADQGVVDSAKGLLRERISLAPNQNLSDWQLNPSYAIASANTLTTTSELVNAILLSSTSSEGDIIEATGLYVNNELYAATEDGDTLRQYLQETMDRHKAMYDPAATVDFTRSAICDEPGEEGVYFVAGVRSAEAIIEDLERNVSEAYVIVADGGLTLGEIAHDYGLTLEVLKARNPEYLAEGDEYVPPAGRPVIIRRAEPFLQVQASIRRDSTEELPYQQLEEEDDQAVLNTRNVVQQGVPGLQQVYDDYVYIDGELSHTERVDALTSVLQEPVDEITLVGTYAIGSGASSEFGEYLFPVPAATWSSRGINLPSHYGIDINAAEGTPIFACNAGEVTMAGWHWSYGYYVVIRHPDNMVTLYGHCSSLAVESGNQVGRGELIGTMGSTGVSTGNHLHLEFQVDGVTRVDPLDYVTPPDGFRMDWRR